MGMAASQARLLSITSRLHDVEYKAQNLQNAKLQLATQQDAAYEDYLNALDQRTLTFQSVDAFGNRSDLVATFDNLFSVNAANTATGNFYALIDSRGRVVVSDDVEDNYDGFTHSNNVQNANLFALYMIFGEGFANDQDFNQIADAVLNERIGTDSHLAELYNHAIGRRDDDNRPFGGQYDHSNNSNSNNNNIIPNTNTNTNTNSTSAGSFAMGAEPDPNPNPNPNPNPKPKPSSNPNQYIMPTSSMFSAVAMDHHNQPADRGANSGNNNGSDNGNSVAGGYDKGNSKGNSAAGGAKGSTPSGNANGNTQVGPKTNKNNNNTTPNPTNNTPNTVNTNPTTSVTQPQTTPATGADDPIIPNGSNLRAEEASLAEVYNSPFTDEAQQFLNYFFNRYRTEIFNNENFASSALPNFDYYVRIFNAIQQHGGCISINDFNGPDGSAANNSEWLTAMIESGQFSLEVFNTDAQGNVTLSGIGVDSDSNLMFASTTQIDQRALAKAEAAYEQAMRIIDRKEKKIDNELNKIETERNALTKEYDSVKKVAEENIERTFGIFS